MAIATKTKPRTTHNKKRTAAHHRQTKHYLKSYWPYLPMVAMVAVGLFVNVLLSRQSAVLGVQTNVSEQALLDATNSSRTSNKLASLTLNQQLEQAAQAKAQNMAHNNYWSHTTPSGEKPWQFITAAGYQYQAAGENLAYGFDSAKSVQTAWMNSPEHRANVLNGNYSQVGFGVAQSANYMGHGPETLIVAMYAQPAGTTSTAAPTTNTPFASEPVSRLQTITGSAAAGLIIGIIGTLAVLAVLVRHSVAWHKLLRRGEAFVLKHPLVDTLLVFVVMAVLVLNHTTGFIG